MINIPNYVSPYEAIRSALGDLGGYDSLMQSLEPDMIRWTAEAQDFISRKKIYKQQEEDFEVFNNKIAWCKSFSMLECLSIGGTPLTLKKSAGCENICTQNCLTLCQGSSQQFSVDECYATFDPPIADGATIHGVFYGRPMGEDGYPLVHELAKIAVAEYVKWKICFRKNDPRVNMCMKRWWELCRIAKGNLGNISDEELQAIGVLYR